MKTEIVMVRLSPAERVTLDRWALLDPEARGKGAVVRRLIREELERERTRDEAANRAG